MTIQKQRIAAEKEIRKIVQKIGDIEGFSAFEEIRIGNDYSILVIDIKNNDDIDDIISVSVGLEGVKEEGSDDVVYTELWENAYYQDNSKELKDWEEIKTILHSCEYLEKR